MSKNKKGENSLKVEPPKIQVTTNYKQFRFHKTNRPIDRSKVEAFKRAMKENRRIFAHNPIWVGADNFIIDGQHRFTAAKELGAPVYFTKDNSSAITTAGEVNKNNDPWRTKEFIHNFSKRGVSNYEKVVTYCEWYMENLEGTGNPPWRSMAALMSHASTKPGGEFKREIQDGKLSDENEDFLEEMLNELKEMQDVTGVDWIRTSAVLSAYAHVKRASEKKKHLDKFDFDQFIEHLNQAPHLFTPQRNREDYIRMFEDIFNYRQRKRARFQ